MEQDSQYFWDPNKLTNEQKGKRLIKIPLKKYDSGKMNKIILIFVWKVGLKALFLREIL